MTAERIVVGASDGDQDARTSARRLRDQGHEVVFVGGGQSPEHLARTAVAEDARRIAVDADITTLERIVEACAALGASDIAVGPLV